MYPVSSLLWTSLSISPWRLSVADVVGVILSKWNPALRPRRNRTTRRQGRVTLWEYLYNGARQTGGWRQRHTEARGATDGPLAAQVGSSIVLVRVDAKANVVIKDTTTTSCDWKENGMKFLAIVGSRNPEGRTAKAVNAFIEGLAEEGSQGEKVFLPGINIERCRQCENDGWGTCRTEGRCVIEDDFAPQVDRLREADIAVLATPVYYGDLSESLRAFLDRMRRVTTHEVGRRGISGKLAIGICVAGGGGGGAPACAVSLEKVLSTCGLDVVDMIPARRQNLAMKLAVLRAMGKWIATGRPLKCDS